MNDDNAPAEGKDEMPDNTLHEDDLQRLRFVWHKIQNAQPEIDHRRPASDGLLKAKVQIDLMLNRRFGDEVPPYDPKLDPSEVYGS